MCEVSSEQLKQLQNPISFFDTRCSTVDLRGELSREAFVRLTQTLLFYSGLERRVEQGGFRQAD